MPSEPIMLEDPDVIAWLMEASFGASGASSAPLKTLSQSPALFPFKISPRSSLDLLLQRRLEVHRHNLILGQARIASQANAKELERAWAKYRKHNALDLYGKKST